MDWVDIFLWPLRSSVHRLVGYERIPPFGSQVEFGVRCCPESLTRNACHYFLKRDGRGATHGPLLNEHQAGQVARYSTGRAWGPE